MILFLFFKYVYFFAHENVALPNEFFFFLNENCLLIDCVRIEDFINKVIKIKVVFEYIFKIKDEFNSPGELKVNEHNIVDFGFGKI